MPVPNDLRWFAVTEFRHPELVDTHAARFLDAVRGTAGVPIHLTSDARTPEENAAASGSSPTSLHLTGRAFDFRYPTSPEDVWKLVDAIYLQAAGDPVELELVHSARDQHIHVALLPAGKVSRLIVRAD